MYVFCSGDAKYAIVCYAVPAVRMSTILVISYAAQSRLLVSQARVHKLPVSPRRYPQKSHRGVEVVYSRSNQPFTGAVWQNVGTESRSE